MANQKAAFTDLNCILGRQNLNIFVGLWPALVDM